MPVVQRPVIRRATAPSRPASSRTARFAAVRRRRAMLPSALVMLPATLIACGGSDRPAAAPIGQPLAAFCAAEVAQDRAFQQLDADAPGFTEALASVQILVDAAVDAAPAEIGDAVAERAAAFADVRASGDPERFFTEKATAAVDAVHDFAIERCDWAQVEVAALDYAYRAEFPGQPGTVSFELSGEGVEPHLLLVARKKDGVGATALDAFHAATDEAALMASFEVVASTFVAPGERSAALAELTAGSYVVYCPIPIGSTMADGGEAEGPPHFTAGMLSAFVVAG